MIFLLLIESLFVILFIFFIMIEIWLIKLFFSVYVVDIGFESLMIFFKLCKIIFVYNKFWLIDG